MVLDPGGLQEAECIADELCQSLPFTDIHLRLQWSRPDMLHRQAHVHSCAAAPLHGDCNTILFMAILEQDVWSGGCSSSL